ncbi:MAG TPA: DedA family protein [Thiobacillaceae bacterium]|nr:DedA family protein [Thiobacillaceae bacterium]HNU65204.1 DedA family protein [Thiobacillaceae bacterium]
MDVATLVSQYGLWAVFAGSVLEGESVLLVAGYAAHRGYLDFAAVVSVAGLGAMLGDQAWFWLGRRHGRWLLARRPGLAARMRTALGLIARYPATAVLAMRFAWGLRSALPVAVGMSRLHAGHFLLLNLLSALLWAPLVAGLGWAFGSLISRYDAHLHRYEHWLAGGLIALALLAHWLYRRHAARGA